MVSGNGSRLILREQVALEVKRTGLLFNDPLKERMVFCVILAIVCVVVDRLLVFALRFLLLVESAFLVEVLARPLSLAVFPVAILVLAVTTIFLIVVCKVSFCLLTIRFAVVIVMAFGFFKRLLAGGRF